MTVRRAVTLALVASLAVFLAPGFARAAPLAALTLGSPGVLTTNGMVGGAMIGFRFTADADLQVNTLGILDDDGDGFVDDHLVTLWTDGGVLLASASFTPGDPGSLDNGFRYKAAPVMLAAGSTYRIAASQAFHSDGWPRAIAERATPDTRAAGSTSRGSPRPQTAGPCIRGSS